MLPDPPNYKNGTVTVTILVAQLGRRHRADSVRSNLMTALPINQMPYERFHQDDGVCAATVWALPAMRLSSTVSFSTSLATVGLGATANGSHQAIPQLRRHVHRPVHQSSIAQQDGRAAHTSNALERVLNLHLHAGGKA